jgi:hypothetical protein
MKNIKIAIVLFSLTGLGFASCEKMENVSPKTQVNKLSTKETLKISTEGGIIPPDLPTGNGGPR